MVQSAMAQNPETVQTCANIGGMVAHGNWWLMSHIRKYDVCTRGAYVMYRATETP